MLSFYFWVAVLVFPSGFFENCRRFQIYHWFQKAFILSDYIWSYDNNLPYHLRLVIRNLNLSTWKSETKTFFLAVLNSSFTTWINFIKVLQYQLNVFHETYCKKLLECLSQLRKSSRNSKKLVFLLSSKFCPEKYFLLLSLVGERKRMCYSEFRESFFML